MTRSGDNGVAPRTANEVTSTCAKPATGELLPFVLLFVALLLPDVTEIGVPGLLTLKRKVAEQEKRTEQQELRLSALQANVQNTHVSPSISLNLHGYRESVLQKGEELSNSAPTPDAQDVQASTDRSILIRRLDQLSLRLQEKQIAASEPGASRLLRNWSSIYSREIALALDTARQTAHNPFFASIFDLREIIEGSEQMLKMLEST